MKDFVKRMITEHAELSARINRLEKFIYNKKQSDKVSRVEFANMLVQLKAMRCYQDALGARLYNNGIEFNINTGKYTEVVAQLKFAEEALDELDNESKDE